MATIKDYKYPGEHVFDGITFNASVYPDILRRIRDELELEATDIVLASYPKSGTTWMQEIIYSIMVGPGEAAKRTNAMDDIFRFVDMQRWRDGVRTFHMDLLATDPPPRLVKTHLPSSFYERHLRDEDTSPKLIIIVRNPKDTLVSYYHFHRMLTPLKFDFTWDEFFEKFKMNTLGYGDVLEYGLSWWKHRNHPNVLIVQYEELLADSVTLIGQVAEFLGRPLTDEVVKRVQEQASFEAMRQRGVALYHTNPFLSEKEFRFFREGGSGRWGDYFSAEQSDHMDKLIQEHCEPLGLRFLETGQNTD